MEIDLSENKDFRTLLSGDFLNGNTARAFLAEAMKETIGPSGIARGHLITGRGSWAPLSAATVRRKGHRTPFIQTGRVQRAVSTAVSNGKLLSWGSSADIYAGNWKPLRFSGNGIYASVKADKNSASLVIGFNGRYKHSAGFNRIRTQMARERHPGRKVDAKTARKLVSVSQVERRMKSVNADRRARGLKTIRKTAAMGSQGIKGRGHVLARGGDNLAYADIVQRGKFKGIHGVVSQNVSFGLVKRFGGPQLVNAKGLSAHLRSGKYVKGTAVHGVARPLLPYKASDESRLKAALDRSMKNLARNFK